MCSLMIPKERQSRIEQRGNVYPEIVIDSVNMLQHDKALAENDYDKLAQYLLRSLSNLKAAGAELAAITANTEHIVWNMVHSKFPLPVISIVEATIREIKRKGFKNVLVFGTMFTLKSRLYENALNNQGITAIIPSGNDISTIDSLIYPNMENGIIIPADKQKLVKMAEKYISEKNADSILLGCTELPLAITYCDVSVPILNTTEIHINEIYRKATQV